MISNTCAWNALPFIWLLSIVFLLCCFKFLGFFPLFCSAALLGSSAQLWAPWSSWLPIQRNLHSHRKVSIVSIHTVHFLPGCGCDIPTQSFFTDLTACVRCRHGFLLLSYVWRFMLYPLLIDFLWGHWGPVSCQQFCISIEPDTFCISILWVLPMKVWQF